MVENNQLKSFNALPKEEKKLTLNTYQIYAVGNR